MITVALGGDHAGFSYKRPLMQMLELGGVYCKDFGPPSEASVDYPDFTTRWPLPLKKGNSILAS